MSATAVASTARLLARAGLVEGFGHVSAREGEGFLLTSTRPLGAAGTEDVHALDAEGAAAPGAEDVPLEAPLHACIYAGRADVGAICRTHSPAAVAWGARDTAPPLLHGLGALAGEVRTCSRTDLVADRPAAEEATAALGAADCLVLRANGCLATGTDLAEAAVYAYFLEGSGAGSRGGGRDRKGDVRRGATRPSLAGRPPRGKRASRWLVWKFGDGESPSRATDKRKDEESST